MQTTGTFTDMLKGALAGAASLWLMDRLDWMMVRHEDPDAWERTKAVRPNHMDPAHNIASRISQAIGTGPIHQPHPAGIATHYAIAVAPAAVYGAVREHLPGGVMGRGVALGLGMFVVEDEVINPLLGVAAKPQDYPWQAHARGLVSHLVLGLAIEVTLSALEPANRSRRTRPDSRR